MPVKRSFLRVDELESRATKGRPSTCIVLSKLNSSTGQCINPFWWPFRSPSIDPILKLSAGPSPDRCSSTRADRLEPRSKLRRARGAAAPTPTSAEAPGESAKLDVDQLPPIGGASIAETDADQADEHSDGERKFQTGSDKPSYDFNCREKRRRGQQNKKSRLFIPASHSITNASTVQRKLHATAAPTIPKAIVKLQRIAEKRHETPRCSICRSCRLAPGFAEE